MATPNQASNIGIDGAVNEVRGNARAAEIPANQIPVARPGQSGAPRPRGAPPRGGRGGRMRGRRVQGNRDATDGVAEFRAEYQGQVDALKEQMRELKESDRKKVDLSAKLPRKNLCVEPAKVRLTKLCPTSFRLTLSSVAILILTLVLTTLSFTFSDLLISVAGLAIGGYILFKLYNNSYVEEIELIRDWTPLERIPFNATEGGILNDQRGLDHVGLDCVRDDPQIIMYHVQTPTGELDLPVSLAVLAQLCAGRPFGNIPCDVLLGDVKRMTSINLPVHDFIHTDEDGQQQIIACSMIVKSTCELFRDMRRLQASQLEELNF